MSSYLEPYIVKSGDTLWKIALEHNFNWQDLVAIQAELNPDFDINRLQIGQEIQILIPGYEVAYAELKDQLEAKQAYNEILAAWERGDVDYLKENVGFEITPNRPISRWLDHTMNILANLWQKDIRANGPANVDSRYIKDAVCAHQARRWDKVSFNPNDLNIPYELRKLISEFNLDAWMFSDVYPATGFFTIPEAFDWREKFSRTFVKGVNPIQNEAREDYMQGLSDLLWYFSEQGKVGTKIPTKFLYTNAQGAITWSGNSYNQASHIITYLGERVSDPFIAGEYETMIPVPGFEFGSRGIELSDFLAYLVQDQTDMYFILNPVYHDQIKQRISVLGSHIDFWINGEKIDVAEALKDGNIRIQASDSIQLWGSVAMDGFHLYTSPNQQESSEMTTRLRPLWVHFASGVMFPANIIEPTQEMQKLGFTGEYASIQSKIQVTDFVSLRPGQDAKTVIQEYLAQQTFSLPFSLLDEAQTREIERQYSLQSLGHQLYGNQNFWGTEWRNGTPVMQWRFPEESVTFAFKPIEIFDTSNIEDLYAQYISERKKEYYEQLALSGCEDITFPFISVLFFPGDNLNAAIYQIEEQIKKEDVYLAYGIRNLNTVKRALFLNKLFGEKIVGGNIGAGEKFLLGKDEIRRAYTQVSLPTFESDFELVTMSWEISPHSALLEKMIPDSDILTLMKYILANESYLNNEGELNVLGRVLSYDFASRRGIKDYMHMAKTTGFTDMMNEELLPEYTSFRVPETSSQGDYQMRFPNLYGNDYKNSWPGKDLPQALSLILDARSIFWEDIAWYQAEFPNIVDADIEIVREIKNLFENDPENTNGPEIAEKLNLLMRLDDGRMSNIIGFIISASLAQEKLEEHVTNIAQQLTLLWINISSLNAQEYERLIRLAMLTFNMWEGKEFVAMSENYIIRILWTLWEKYHRELNFPTVERTGWIRNQIIYSQFVFFNHIPLFRENIEILRQSGINPEERKVLEILETSLEQIDSNRADYQSHLYSFLAQKEVHALLDKNAKSSLPLPTLSDFQWTTSDFARVLFASYASEGIIENRVQKPHVSDSQKAFVYWMGTAIWVYSIQQLILNPILMGIAFPIKKIGKTLWISWSEFLLALKRRRKKKALNTFKKKTSSAKEYDIDDYLDTSEGKAQTPEERYPKYIISNEFDFSQYKDGYYKIGEKWIETYSNTILDSTTKNYKDGYYKILPPLSPLEQELRKLGVTIKPLEEGTTNEMQVSLPLAAE